MIRFVDTSPDATKGNTLDLAFKGAKGHIAISVAAELNEIDIQLSLTPLDTELLAQALLAMAAEARRDEFR